MNPELHPNEKPFFRLAGKAYFWVRVNGQLQARPALTPDGELKPEALDRLAKAGV